MSPAKHFEKRFVRSIARLQKRLDAYLEDPADHVSVHDIRTSLRRLDSIFPLLGKKDRKANRQTMSACKDLFRANSALRDYDIIAARLGAISPAARPIVDAMLRERDKMQEHAVMKAKKLKKAKRLSVSIDPDEFEGRLDKVTRRLGAKIKAGLSAARVDDGNPKEIHSLRKNLKKLRYILESLDSSTAKKCKKIIKGEVGIPVNIALLKDLQDLLGRMHDIDITLNYLESSGSHVAKALRVAEERARRQLYLEFVAYLKGHAS